MSYQDVRHHYEEPEDYPIDWTEMLVECECGSREWKYDEQEYIAGYPGKEFIDSRLRLICVACGKEEPTGDWQ